MVSSKLHNLTIKKSRFSTYKREGGDDELNDIIRNHNHIINKVTQLNDNMDDANVKLSIDKGQKLFGRFTEYKDLRELHSKLIKLRVKLARTNITNSKLNMLIDYLNQFLQKAQTGDILPLTMTTNTKHGNLIEKMLKNTRGKGKTKRRMKKAKSKKQILKI
jgi:hypothetical protein